MVCRIYLVLLLGGVVLNPISIAQQYGQLELLNTEDGLSQGMIFDILKDRDGFLWIATKDGLNQYNGHDFKTFVNDPNDPWSISGNHIIHLFEDSKGRIWASTENEGLNIYDKTSERFHRLEHNPDSPSGLTGEYITAIAEDTSGYFIVNVDYKELNMFRLNEDFFTKQTPPQIIRVPVPDLNESDAAQISSKDHIVKNIKGVATDAKKRIWVSGYNTIFQLNCKKAKLIPAIEGLSFVNAHPDDNGGIWFISNKSFPTRWDGENIQAIPAKLTEENYDTKEILNMGFINDSILIGNTNAGIYSLDLKEHRNGVDKNKNDSKAHDLFWTIEVNRTLIKHNVSAISIGQSGKIWIGTNGYGVYKTNLKKSLFSHHLPGISIRRIYPISKSEFVSKDLDGAIQNLDGSMYTKLDVECPPWWPWNTGELLYSKSGSLWLKWFGFTVDGVLSRKKEEMYYLRKYEANLKTYKEYYYSWHHGEQQPMMESKDGILWMAGIEDILSKIDPETGKYISFNTKDGRRIEIKATDKRNFYLNLSTAIYEDNKGILWVGTERGVTKCERSKNDEYLTVTAYENIPGDLTSLSYNHVTCILDDPKNPNRYLWVCTKGGGLNRFDKNLGTFTSITKDDGLPDNVIYGILTDNAGNIWGSTNKGLFCMNQHQDTQNDDAVRYTFRNFSKNDGLQENEFNTGAYAKIPDGRLAFGGINGYNVFDPKEVLSDVLQPPIFITNLSVNNEKIFPNEENGILKSSIATTNKITLNYNDNILALEFASLDFTAPNQNKYRYQLEGAGDSWVEKGTSRSATFLNLQPGNYTFRVQGTNSQGIWSGNTAELDIQILPPWWKNWWAYLAYISIIIAGIALYFRFWINRAKLRQQLTYEKRETDRVKELDALKTQLYMNMTHEFRTPLTIILGMTKQVQNNPKEHFTSGLNMIARNGENLLNLVNKMLNLSKLESGKMKLDLVHGDIILFLRNIVESYHSYVSNKEIKLHFLPENDLVMMDFDSDKLQQIISNLISNAFKFTPEGGHIYVTLRKEENSMVIRVKDTGRGIPKNDLEKIFDRFYQVDNSTTRRYDGSGIGLALSKELVTLMEGKISAQSPPTGLRKGSEFKVELPIHKGVEIMVSESFDIPIKQPDILELEKGQNAIDGMSGISVETIIPNKQEKPMEQKVSIPLILLVEDNKDVAAYIASCLPNDYRLVIAEDGQEGLEIAIELVPDLVISDVMMPRMDGFEFCKQLKSDERIGHIPVIILTARVDLESKIEGLELGANAYLPKPFERQELLLTINNLFSLRDKLHIHYQNIGGVNKQVDAEEEINETKPEDVFVLKVRSLIEAQIDDFDLSVARMAKDLYLSQSQLGRKLDALTGMSPSRFIRIIRLKKAKELLQNEALSIREVSYDIGISDPSYFSRVFKKEFGLSPAEWRSLQVANN
ncbi:MAG: ATP-binding protein [Saprospiraceae bacterium]|nr:ATP-binding protein [Saprospiraceae bacterium]